LLRNAIDAAVGGYDGNPRYVLARFASHLTAARSVEARLSSPTNF
jgi:hypothetical protein